MSAGSLSEFQRNLDSLRVSGSDALILYEALPESVKAEWNQREIIRTADQRYMAGQVELVSRKRRRPRPRLAARPAVAQARTGGTPLSRLPQSRLRPTFQH